MRWGRRALDRARGDLNLDRLVSEGLQLGEGAFVARHAYLDPVRPWLISIGAGANIGPFVNIVVHDASLLRSTGFARIARVDIGKRVVVGTGAIILPGTRIGDDCIVAAGAVVRGDVEPGSVVVGNPAKVVSRVDTLAVFHRAGAAKGPTWPSAGWTAGLGITAARKREQREALGGGVSGYIDWRGQDAGAEPEGAAPRA